ncbi:hypothetical protein OAO87_04150 [bacterium]|nr:hypothetical protein [bacterium]
MKCTFDFDALPKIDDIKGIVEGIAANSGLDIKQLSADLIYNCLRYVDWS